ncbi:DNA repair protein RadA [Flavobacterium branchiophilum]|uniref:DNA repair protein RadA n=2 Tax=Flavobacterium branchiophilum TaxID=55197 RepID=G2Z6C5_FLABF|nr:DNA repair protein RadA [Flavobacterium branchiophilum]OXA74918.1 DNA repair protein RadA [Flavobacterium branchiophilum] [Flavobacterium branchiophilum NBRC 15030 = ATCC 35035]PDS23389.1 DNA repair protein RadA [Flavobacterium branchiophilum]TQM40358.1 DNA repair protein RadA/Sms [Flavobacterium branchiophilum]CCB70945.1 DNA repair protein RadA [Flavobacterium branchiophilum FL-15]GEM54440.1 DNA repair protein RadA [Flavobacterium branchiophilum NBRC 15030 = ATCC 35035]
MAKIKTAFYCQSCGNQYSKWQGQCNACKEWNTIVEEIIQKETKVAWKMASPEIVKASKPLRINEIDATQEVRMNTTDEELNRVLGGGIVPGSLILLGGEPGIGKSTLLLQISLKLPYKTLYVSGEESQKQIKMRAERITHSGENCFILTETKTQNIFKQIENIAPEIVIIDSIQTLHTEYIESSPGSISQIRECTAELIKFAKETNVPVILIGHITKDGSIAGPKILEHMVDTVLQFEGDRNHVYRILRSLKNRFGSTAELGIYEMMGSGLREVTNPSEILISHKNEELSGTAIASTLEGMRPLMIEIQALVSTAVYGTPQRSTTGYNAKRLNMILAVLEKRAGFRLGAKDVFLNVTGGISIDDPALDLSVVAAILSSNEDIPVGKDFCFAGEVGLSGEIRPVNRVDQRIQEAEKLGFSTIFVSKYNKIALKNTAISIRLVAKIEDIASELFG